MRLAVSVSIYYKIQSAQENFFCLFIYLFFLPPPPSTHPAVVVCLSPLLYYYEPGDSFSMSCFHYFENSLHDFDVVIAETGHAHSLSLGGRLAALVTIPRRSHAIASDAPSLPQTVLAVVAACYKYPLRAIRG